MLSPSIASNFHEAYAAEWNLDIQRAITNNLTVSVAYVGNHGFDQFTHIDQNQRPLGVGLEYTHHGGRPYAGDELPQ